MCPVELLPTDWFSCLTAKLNSLQAEESGGEEILIFVYIQSRGLHSKAPASRGTNTGNEERNTEKTGRAFTPENI